jgi:DNA/RNA-binding domain of Phe-tRNA-synthetase-like protein
MLITNIQPSLTDVNSEAILSLAKASAKQALAPTPIHNNSHVIPWREAYRSFGAKPKKAPSSLEALLKCEESDLSRVNQLIDIYNAISIKHQIPLGGENLDKYAAAPFLIRAKGEEYFIQNRVECCWLDTQP